MRRLKQIDAPVIRKTLRRVNPSDLRRLEEIAIKVRSFIDENNADYNPYVMNVGVRKPAYDENPPKYGIALYMVHGQKLPDRLVKKLEREKFGSPIFQCVSIENSRFRSGR